MEFRFLRSNMRAIPTSDEHAIRDAPRGSLGQECTRARSGRDIGPRERASDEPFGKPYRAGELIAEARA
jgi:hypothetical protein